MLNTQLWGFTEFYNKNNKTFNILHFLNHALSPLMRKKLPPRLLCIRPDCDIISYNLYKN